MDSFSRWLIIHRIITPDKNISSGCMCVCVRWDKTGKMSTYLKCANKFVACYHLKESCWYGWEREKCHYMSVICFLPSSLSPSNIISWGFIRKSHRRGMYRVDWIPFKFKSLGISFEKRLLTWKSLGLAVTFFCLEINWSCFFRI